ncbi:Elongator complex protein 1 [Lamellibrachia satsuma]|nr:Elongator complex protein 1 [Lamellibrachia satsuma]
MSLPWSTSQCICVDYDTKAVYCATTNGIRMLDPSMRQVTKQISLVTDGYLPPDGSGIIVDIEHLPDQMAVCVATWRGDIVLWSTVTDELEGVGSVDSGLRAVAWSPDQELLTLSTGQDTLIMMTRDFDPILEMAIHATEFGEAEPINVGWGKKATQFHGSEGKQAALQTYEQVKGGAVGDDQRTRISWRGDGQCFAVSAICPRTGGRTLRTWTREGVLYSTAEMVPGLEQALAWKPSGSLIVSSQRRPNKHNIIFFERNGLRHGEFTLPFGVHDVKVKEVLWNTESTVLAVWCEDLPPEGGTVDFAPKSYSQYNIGLYLLICAWDSEQAYRLHVVCRNGQYLQYTWSWTTDVSRGSTQDDVATVAVIDGATLLVTPFKDVVVPPPMSAYTVQMPCAINQVAFLAENNDFAVMLSDGHVALLSFGGKDKIDRRDKTEAQESSVKIAAAAASKCSLPRICQMFSLDPTDTSTYPLMCYHLTWINEDTMIYCTPGGVDSSTLLTTAKVDYTTLRITAKDSVCVGGSVAALAVGVHSSCIAVHLTDGAICRYMSDTNTLLPWETSAGTELRLPQCCPLLAVCCIGGEEVVIGLTERYRLYANDVELASNCTSFCVHSKYLLLSTHAHTCRCISLARSLSELQTATTETCPVLVDQTRRVERGSRIVCVETCGTKLVLQMPRGNLEVIHPRALVLASVKHSLDQLQFGDAFALMRKHRINMNLLHDHNPAAFLDNINSFVQQIDSVSFVNLFLTNLLNEDVTETMYSAAYDNREVKSRSREGDMAPSKVDAICDCLREAMERTDASRYLLSSLTAMVRRTTPHLQAALDKIKSLPKECVKEALDYLLFLVDVDALYNVALGMYDFDLVLLVAQSSHKDPKEYLPFLNELRCMEENYRRYSIDLHLQNYSGAICHVAKCGIDHFPECLRLVTQHCLYAEALPLFDESCEEYKKIAVAYGQYLSGRGRHEEAGIIYSRARDHQMALDEFFTCSNWRQAMCMAAELNYSTVQLADLGRNLAGKLQETRRHLEAATLLTDYADDVEEAIVTLIEGSEWDEALRLMYKCGRNDFTETNLKPALFDSCQHHMTYLESARADFDRHLCRLVVVRQEKQKAWLDLMEGGGDHCRADTDLYSDTSSAMGDSVSGRCQGVQGRVGGKAERKRWSLREGSPHEELALVDALAKIIHRVDDMKGEVSRLMKAQLLFGSEKEAAGLQTLLDTLLRLIDRSLAQIWDNTAQEEDPAGPEAAGFGPESTANTIALAMQQGLKSRPDQQIEPVLRTPPTISSVEWKLSLLQKTKNT